MRAMDATCSPAEQKAGTQSRPLLRNASCGIVRGKLHDLHCASESARHAGDWPDSGLPQVWQHGADFSSRGWTPPSAESLASHANDSVHSTGSTIQFKLPVSSADALAAASKRRKAEAAAAALAAAPILGDAPPDLPGEVASSPAGGTGEVATEAGVLLRRRVVAG